jgi:hypothetical protein
MSQADCTRAFDHEDEEHEHGTDTRRQHKKLPLARAGVGAEPQRSARDQRAGGHMTHDAQRTPLAQPPPPVGPLPLAPILHSMRIPPALQTPAPAASPSLHSPHTQLAPPRPRPHRIVDE